MSKFYRELDIIVEGDKAELSEPLFVYQGDFGIEIRFNLNTGKLYKFDNDTDNLLNSYNGAYVDTTLIKPSKTETEIANAPIIKDGQFVFVISKDLTDDLDEVGIYKMQIHIGNTPDDEDTSIFTLPYFTFEVKARESGIPGGALLTETNTPIETEEGSIIEI